MKRINLVQVVYGFSVGGAELKLLELITRLNRNLFNISVICVASAGRWRSVCALGAGALFAQVAPPDYTLPFAGNWSAAAGGHHDDHAVFADIMALCRPMCKTQSAIPEAITGRLRFHQKMYQLTSGRFDMVVAVSNSIWPYIIRDQKDPQKIQTIYYGVDLRGRACAGPSHARILSSAPLRVWPTRGHRYLLRPFQKW